MKLAESKVLKFHNFLEYIIGELSFTSPYYHIERVLKLVLNIIVKLQNLLKSIRSNFLLINHFCNERIC
jgi:hypothetical protein